MVPEIQVRKIEILHDLCTECSTNLTFATPVFIKAIGRFGSETVAPSGHFPPTLLPTSVNQIPSRMKFDS
ncbi:hypothetical protein LMG1873_01612 [Achromobacter piechaudii]|uniref:Uncharacterized protein n=1 Tax=Achromobacter piechaudii TaxID=72556 RepID=A0ABN7EWC1_9BURK|nr:hypothetical protein LMG1873_01612 [Achromobacter piechaudii]CAB3871529.1 hypothetical protein LMG2828_03009 [Achromobacter piechaudii]CAB3947841.1 hypothetical protein LMG6103_01732 [Achromobacter piechaudii]